MTENELELAERERLAQLEEVVERGLQTFIEVGQALREIRDSRLYRQTHTTFGEYLVERWSFSKPHATRLIQAAQVVAAVPMGTAPPANERQARELVPLLDNPDALAETWREVQGEHGDGLTAAKVREAVNGMKAPLPVPGPDPRTIEERLAGVHEDIRERVLAGRATLEQAESVTVERAERLATWVGQIRQAVDVLCGLVAYKVVPAGLTDALTDDERVVLVAALAAIPGKSAWRIRHNEDFDATARPNDPNLSTTNDTGERSDGGRR
jgi:hypothetical protein